jgi:putative FmdB family regulatory protein
MGFFRSSPVHYAKLIKPSGPYPGIKNSMPIYEYICDECETQFERIVLNKAQEIACPNCSGTKNTIQLSVFSVPNGNASSSKQAGATPAGGGSCCGGGCGCH